MSMPRYRSLAMVHPDFDADAGPAGLRLAPGGGLASVTDAASVRQSLLLLLSTRPGERVNRPDPQVLAQRDLRGLDGEGEDGPAAQERQQQLAVAMRSDQVTGVLRRQPPVVEAVRQDEHVRGEPVAADVGDLPGVLGCDVVQCPAQRSAELGAAGIVLAVGAHAEQRLVVRRQPR